MLSPSTSSSDFKMCAPAYTVKMVLSSNNTAPKLSEHFVDTAPAGSVIVIDAPPQAKSAVWGGLMTAGAQARSAVGVIISGRCRDLAEHRASNFPVFARGHSTVGQSPFVRPSAVNISLLISPQGEGELEEGSAPFEAVRVEPGDWMVADEDGVVCVPQGIVEKVVELTRKGRKADEKCMEDIKAGKGVQASFKLHRGK